MSSERGAKERRGAVSLAPLELLHAEFVAYLVRSHEPGRASSEELHSKLEATGFAVGRRYAERLARDRERPVEVLDVVKFVCREFWQEVHQKAVDKLQTNNKGVFVLQDFNFRWVRFISARTAPAGDAGAAAAAAAQAALQHIVFPCGMIRGALAAYDVDAVVNADLSASPRVLFHVQVRGAT
jgi:hypothetical protein